MRKLKTRLFLTFICFIFTAGTILQAQQLKLDAYFPETTQIYVSISNVKALADNWQKTQFYETLAAPQFQEFRDSLRQQIETAWPNRLGLKFDDFTTLPSGEIGAGLIAIPGKRPGFAVMMNVDGNASEVNDFLVKLIRQTTEKRNGEATKERITVGRQAVDATALSFPNAKTGAVTRVYYVVLPQLLIATDQKYVAELLLRKLAGESRESLAQRPEYQAVFKRCADDSPNASKGQIRFFASPMAAGEAIRSLAPPEALKGRSPFVALSNQGFAGIEGVGGTVDFATEPYEMVTRVKVYIPNPPTKALKALSFANVDSLSPPNWIGENASRYTLVNLNALATFNNAGPLFDEFLETEGAWNDVLDSLEKDKLGPQVNLRSEIFANLGRQLSTTSAFDPNAKEDGEKFIFSYNILEGKEAAVAGALHKMFEADPDFQCVEILGNEFWKYAPQPGAATRPAGTRPSATRPAGTRPAPVRPGATRPGATADAQPRRNVQPGAEAELIKGVVFGVANGALYVSNDAQYLQTKLAANASADVVLNTPEHRRAMRFLANEPAVANGLFALGYGRNVDGIRENYELFRQGKTPQGKTLGAKLLNAILTQPGQKEVRTPKFDGSALPPFDETMVKNVGFNLFFGVVENDGFYFKGFSARSGAEATPR